MGKVRMGWMGGVIGVVAFTAAGKADAQTHVAKKPEAVVRAVGVYEWTGELGKAKASRLVPVSLFINGQLEDGAVYLARPVPMALERGTLFELDKAGQPAATLELAYARHLQTAGTAQLDDGWIGYGAVKPIVREPELASKSMKSGPLSKVIVNGGKKGEPGATSRPETMDTAKSGDGKVDRSTANTGAVTADAEPNRPTMRKGADPPAQSSGDAESRDAKDDVDRPTLKKRTPAQTKAAEKQHDQASVAGVGSLNDDPDRPVIHRGKPVARMEEDDLPRLVGLPPDMQQMVAVSDATNRPEHEFVRSWASEEERAAVLGKMNELARARLAAYAGGSPNAGASVGAVRPTRTVGNARAAGRRPGVAGAGAATLSDEDLRAYTLSYGGAATYVLTATSGAAGGVTRYVSVVAQQEPTGELKVALSSVTDAAHLNRAARLRIVDAVDAEASNRASLLFELRAQSSRQFALYRVIGAQAEQTFVTGTVAN